MLGVGGHSSGMPSSHPVREPASDVSRSASSATDRSRARTSNLRDPGTWARPEALGKAAGALVRNSGAR